MYERSKDMINFRFDISKVELEDSYAVIEYGVAENRERLYFIAPKEWVEDKYPEAEGSTIICSAKAQISSISETVKSSGSIK